MMSCRGGLTAVFIGGLCGVSLCANPINRTFNIAGPITVTRTNISWSMPANHERATEEARAEVQDKQLVDHRRQVSARATSRAQNVDDFSDGAGSTVVVANANAEAQAAASNASAQVTSNFAVAPSFPSLYINLDGLFGNGDCGFSARFGAPCSQPVSSSNLLNISSAQQAALSSSSSLAPSAAASQAVAEWQPNYLGQLMSSASPTVNLLAPSLPSPSAAPALFFGPAALEEVPEPGTLLLFGAGLTALHFLRRRL